MIEYLLTAFAVAIVALAVYFVWYKGTLPPPGLEGPWLRTMERRQAKEVVELLREVIETARDANEAFEKMRRLIDPKKGPRPDQALVNISLEAYAGIKPKETLEEYAKRIGQQARPPRILLEEDED